MNTLSNANLVKPEQDEKTPDASQPEAPAPNFAGTSVPRHLARGAVGFGLIAGAIALVPLVGPAALLAAPPALIAFRGCPTCWMVGLAQTVSRSRLERRCVDGVCTIAKADGRRPNAEEARLDGP
ncbi:hypothetical protein [Streptomyces parvus]|uniref:hypothetical protein n=1 Tax=Streptomyces parvus TaxID=66428 RepID=UPI0035D7C794